jgi:FHA domain-containing protein
MITITAVSYQGAPLATPLSAEFDEAGGSLGRGDDNTLVLPDPERHVSRRHASVACVRSRWLLRDTGSASPVFLNEQPVGSGNEVRLQHADMIRVGGYTLRVSLAPEPAASSLESTISPFAAPPADAAPLNDPLQIFGVGAATSPSPSQRAIPADYDPFADMFAPAPSKAAPAARPDASAELRLGTGDTAGQSLDQLFGLGAGAAPVLFPAGNPLSDPGQRPDARDEGDPLVALGAAPAPRYPDTARDDAPQIRAAFVPPVASFGAAPLAPIGKAAEHEMVFSWDQPDAGPERPIAVPSPAPVPPPTALQPLPPPAPAARPDPAGQQSGPVDSAELLRALLAGAGVPDLAMPGQLTPQLMVQLGQLLRESTRGTLDLLLSRALVKQEVRAEATIIRPRENNPLKFSPSVEVALAHLLAPKGGGFMAPVPAMKDAYDDLRAHQFGFMAGMRAALDGVLQRFDPAQLELRLSEKSVIDSLVPAARKARLWNRFSELYTEIGKEAGDDFHALFGKAFLRAYEAQLAQLEQNDRGETH